MLQGMFNTLFPSTTKEETQWLDQLNTLSTQENFRTRAKQIGVFAEPVTGYMVNGAVHGGKIKFKNLAVKATARKTATNKLLAKGLTLQ
jgi:hypothetical protein